MRSNPLYAPDGMRMAGFEPQSFAGITTANAVPDAVLPHERHDDGLVHNHHWALTSNACAPAHSAGRGEWPGTSVRIIRDTKQSQAVPSALLPQDRYDDGLVHNHAWATTAN